MPAAYPAIVAMGSLAPPCELEVADALSPDANEPPTLEPPVADAELETPVAVIVTGMFCICEGPRVVVSDSLLEPADVDAPVQTAAVALVPPCSTQLTVTTSRMREAEKPVTGTLLAVSCQLWFCLMC
jgi:hypothetical protein